MSSDTLALRLKDEPIVLTVDGARLAVLLGDGAPAGYVLPSDVQEMIFNEAKSFGQRAADVQLKFGGIVQGRSVGQWRKFHKQLAVYTSWPERYELVTPYSLLCAWADAHLHIAEAQQVIRDGTAQRRTIEGREAALSFNSRWRPMAERAVIQHSMLNPAFHKLVMEL
jgi:hypothetical protein